MSEFKLIAGEDPELKHWHGNVGEAVALDLAGPLFRNVTTLDVLSWNLAIGRARLVELVEKLKAGGFDGEVRRANRPLIILAQEAYRADNSVPAALASKHHGGHAPTRARLDIVELAHALGMSLRYAPSMRNGAHRSDRGNAVLSSVGIAHARAFPLAHVRQRRVVVSVELQGLPWLTLVTAHLDTRGRAQGRSGRYVQATRLGEHLLAEWGTDQTLLVGADFNAYLGQREPMFRELNRAGLLRVAHEGPSRHTFHAPGLRMPLDHFLIREASDSITSITVTRLDETADDSGRYIFGSDHHPLLARIEFAPPNRRIKR
ncbi:MAG TPA: endonuclease/exonuclease/phosphatase family protein [Longimicrobiales bacterium]|nr:endonuclease/exonuclease/phosphatase family protein [Longimicrobiales bacterium]